MDTVSAGSSSNQQPSPIPPESLFFSTLNLFHTNMIPREQDETGHDEVSSLICPTYSYSIPVPVDLTCFGLLFWAPKRVLTKYRGGATIYERDMSGLSIVDPSKSGIDLETECVIKQRLL